MTKEAGQPPKAVNIIRPNTNYGILHNTTSTSSSGSSNSGSIIYQQQQQQKKSHSNNSSVLSSNRKPRVSNPTKINEKPILNLYHPPTRKPSYDRSNSSSIITTTTTSNSNNHSRPSIEIYKPQQQQQQQQLFTQQQQHQPQRMTKSLTAPSLSSSEHNRPISPPFHTIRPSHRSVLGPIVTPVAATTNTTTTTTTTTTQSPTSTIDEPEHNNRSLLEGVQKIVYHTDEQQDTLVNDDVDSNDDEDDEVDTIEEEEEEEPVINEARVNRKIADLELSINSLLTVNAMLEATVRKQASQLNQMKQKMLSGESVDNILNEVTIIDVVEDHQINGVAEEEEEDWDKDVLFQRLRKITEYMIEQGQKSIDYEYKILGRVLSNYEQNDDDDDDDDDEEEEDDTIQDNTNTLPLPEKSKSDSISPTKSIPVPSSIPLPTTHYNNRIPKLSSKKRNI